MTSNGNGNDNDNNFCKNAKESLGYSLIEANATLKELRPLIGEYTKSLSKLTPDEYYNQWSTHKLGLEYPYMGYLKHHADYIVRQNEEKEFDKLFFEEIDNIYITLKLLETAFENITNEREANKTNLLANYGEENFENINNYFNKAKNHIQKNLQRVQNIFSQFQKRPPTCINPDGTKDPVERSDLPPASAIEKFYYKEPKYNKETFNPELYEPLMVFEHLSFMQFLSELYEKLQLRISGHQLRRQDCPVKSASPPKTARALKSVL